MIDHYAEACYYLVFMLTIDIVTLQYILLYTCIVIYIARVELC